MKNYENIPDPDLLTDKQAAYQEATEMRPHLYKSMRLEKTKMGSQILNQKLV